MGKELKCPSDIKEVSFNGQNIAVLELELAGSSRTEAVRNLLSEMQDILTQARRIGWEF